MSSCRRWLGTQSTFLHAVHVRIGGHFCLESPTHKKEIASWCAAPAGRATFTWCSVCALWVFFLRILVLSSVARCCCCLRSAWAIPTRSVVSWVRFVDNLCRHWLHRVRDNKLPVSTQMHVCMCGETAVSVRIRRKDRDELNCYAGTIHFTLTLPMSCENGRACVFHLLSLSRLTYRNRGVHTVCSQCGARIGPREIKPTDCGGRLVNRKISTAIMSEYW